jgi:hypothetical protein
MKYFRDQISGLDYHTDGSYDYAATDRDGSLYLYQNKPETREALEVVDKKCFLGGYWTGGKRSSDYCVVQRDSHFPEWEFSLQKITDKDSYE